MTALFNLEISVALKSTILLTQPTSYWPLDDSDESGIIHDECGLNHGTASEVALAEVPFGPARMPHFDGRQQSAITIPDDHAGRYSHEYANSITVACWVAPSSLDFCHTDGSQDRYVHMVEKAMNYDTDVEWAFRLYNATNDLRHSRLSFYLFNLGHPALKGAGAYMQYGWSANDTVPVRARRWLFLVGQGEPWIDDTEESHGAIFHKQGISAVRSPGDKINKPPDWKVHPQRGAGVINLGGSIGKTAYCGSIGHLALWNRLLTNAEIAHIYLAGQAELLRE